MDFGENVSYKKDKVYLIFEISLIFSLFYNVQAIVPTSFQHLPVFGPYRVIIA